MTKHDRTNPARGARWAWLVFAAWLLVIVVAMVLVWSYKLAPGAAAANTSAWPADSVLPPDHDRSSLIMFVHPRCPCTLASLDELAEALANHPSEIAPRIVFYLPVGQPESWAHGPSWDAAHALPHARMALDVGGREAARWGAGTSGHTVVVSRSGQVLFAGGITPARGHVGDGPGRAGLVAALTASIPSAQVPVFGCSLEETP